MDIWISEKDREIYLKNQQKYMKRAAKEWKNAVKKPSPYVIGELDKSGEASRRVNAKETA